MATAEERLRVLERVTRETDTAQWRRTCPAEGWPVALVCYHIAGGFDRQASFIEAAAKGTGPHRFNWEETNALHARTAAEHPLPTREEVLTMARAAIERIRSLVSAMSDADLATVAFVYGSFQGSAEWIVRTFIAQHADGHLASVTATPAG